MNTFSILRRRLRPLFLQGLSLSLCVNLVSPALQAQTAQAKAPVDSSSAADTAADTSVAQSSAAQSSAAQSKESKTQSETAPEPAPSEQTTNATPRRPLAELLQGAARAEYESGRILYLDGDYVGAAQKFARAYELAGDYRLLWNVAAAEKNLRHYSKVYELVQRYLSEGKPYLRPEDRREAEVLLDAVKAFVAELVVNVNQPGALIFVDAEQVATSPHATPIRVDMGRRRVRVTKHGYEEFSTFHDIHGGSTSVIDVKLKRLMGTIRVIAAVGDTIRIDGKVVARSEWQGRVPPGEHRLEVSAPGKRTYRTTLRVQPGQVSATHVALESTRVTQPESESGIGAAWWLGGGAILAAGLGVGAYFLLKPDPETPQGTIPPGSVQLPFGR